MSSKDASTKEKALLDVRVVIDPETSENLPSPHPAGSPPDERWDGGMDAWLTLVGGWLAMTATFGNLNAYGVFQDFYSISGTASSSLISWIGSMQLFWMTAMGLLSGKLVDSGYFRETVIFGSFLYVFSLFMLSLSSPHQFYQLFLSQGIGMGLGAGFIYIPCLAVQSHHWRSRRPMALGITFTGSAIGGIVFPIMLNQLLQRNVGFAWTVRALAFVTLGCLILANFFMRARPKLVQNATDPKPNIKSLFLDVPYMFLVFGGFLSLTGVFFPYFYVQVFARTHGISDTIGFYTLAILNAASIPGRIVPTLLIPKFGMLNTLMLCGLCCAASIFALFGIHTVAGVVVFSILSGFFTGAVISLLGGATATFARNRGEVGLRMGLAFAIDACGALIGTPVNGVLLGDNFNWNSTVIFSGVTIVAGNVLILVARQTLVRRHGSPVA